MLGVKGRVKCQVSVLYNGTFNGYQLTFLLAGCHVLQKCDSMILKVENRDAVLALFPKTVREIERRVDDTIWEVQKGIDSIVERTPYKRTFDDTVRAEDQLLGQAHTLSALLHLVNMTNPDEALREAAQRGSLKLHAFLIDSIEMNRDLYRAFNEYAEGAGKSEALTDEQRRYLEESLRGFERHGLGLPDEKLKEAIALKKELSELEIVFDSNINKSLNTITVDRRALEGLDESFIESLKRDKEGGYILGVDMPTYTAISEHCTVASTREALWVARENRAYPENEPVLKRIIALRDQLARLLGFPSFAHLNLDDQMAKTPERVQAFLEEMRVKSLAKSLQELALWKKELPDGIESSPSGQIYPWDMAFIKASYKKKHLALDEQRLKEFFSVQRTVDELLSLYEHFLGLEFRQETVAGLWHEDVRYIAAYRQDGVLLGHLLLDLFPRDFKYTHACEMTLVHSTVALEGFYYPAVIAVIANFPKATASQPALLSFRDVETFFHEFGHAMHALLGATSMIGFSGTNTRHDFVETPSQMFEEWLYDPIVLRRVSCHYKTGEPLDDDTIERMCKQKHFDKGTFAQRQVGLALFALNCFAAGEVKDLTALRQRINKLVSPDIVYDERAHFECSFGHLTGYAARYYSYLWSKVFAVDLFSFIKHHGLFSAEVGRSFVEQILGHGGAVEPAELMKNFLGREPSSASFFSEFE